MAAVKPVRGWQVGKTLRECNSYMFDNQVACDIKFAIQSPDGAVVTVPAHKYVLMSRSLVFEAMFDKKFSESTGDVDIFDIESTVFTDMLRFIYTEKTDITADNVLYLMTTARKYILDGLEGKCVEFLEENMDTGNVCTVFEHAVSQRLENIMSKCLELIQIKTLEVLASESFLEISKESLVKLLECDALSVDDEIQILKACKKWAEHKLGKKGDYTEENTRTILGDALFQVRFCSTTIKDIVNNNLQDLLSDKHFKLLATCTMHESSGSGQRVISRKELQQAGFNFYPRLYVPNRILRAVRFSNTSNSTAWGQRGRPDAIGFKVSCQTVKVKQDVMLEQPVRLEAGVRHAVKVTLVEDQCYQGENGLTNIEVEGVTFTFMKHIASRKSTDVHCGQIPVILFKHDTMS